MTHRSGSAQHRSGLSADLQRELKVRETSIIHTLINLSVGVGAAVALCVIGAVSYFVIPH